MRWIGWGVLLCAVGCASSERAGSGDRAYDAPQRPPVRVTMAALHASGGTPPGWELRPATGDVARGRRAFEAQGCASCHRVEGEAFTGGAVDESQGPDLTGMGMHHPPAYFVEAILSPSAVLVEGTGWSTAGGRSTMPSYPEMSIADLTDIVAYLGSLTSGGTHDHAAMMRAAGAPNPRLGARPAPPPSAGRAFFVQRFDVLPGQLGEFETWFAGEGRAAFLAYEGVVSVDTWVVGGSPAMATVIAFRDDATLTAFLNDPRTEPLGERFDAFIGPHGHQTFRTPPIYRAPSLSAVAGTRR